MLDPVSVDMQPPTLCDQAREDGKMAIMTIDQALASPTATGITIVDTPTNIARGSLTASLLPRVTAFNMNANGATSPGDAKLLAGLGTLFSKNSFTLTVRGSVADLTNPANAAGLTLANIKAVFDTAANILAAATQPVITGANSVVMSSSADVSLAGMIAFTTMPSFSVNPGAIITLADTAANLLAITNGQKRGALQAYKVAVDSTVDVDTALDVVCKTACKCFQIPAEQPLFCKFPRGVSFGSIAQASMVR